MLPHVAMLHQRRVPLLVSSRKNQPQLGQALTRSRFDEGDVSSESAASAIRQRSVATRARCASMCRISRRLMLRKRTLRAARAASRANVSRSAEFGARPSTIARRT
jgi:hypothetical protein